MTEGKKRSSAKQRLQGGSLVCRQFDRLSGLSINIDMDEMAGRGRFGNAFLE